MSDIIIQEENTESILKNQRQDSEAADILTEIDKVRSTPPEKKGRWIWELLQNARDCAREGADGKKFVNVQIELTEDRFSFQHDGRCFTHSDLVSLFRKASNKDYQNSEGNSGKYGTGFVTTHLLSRQIIVDAFMQTTRGNKHFQLEMDRTANDPKAMHGALTKAYKAIEQIRTAEGYDEITNYYTRFEFPLTPTAHDLAKETLRELKNNIYFTLRCNTWIQSVTVIEHIGEMKQETVLKEHEPIIFSKVLTYFPLTENIGGHIERGLLYYDGMGSKIGILAAKLGEAYNILPWPRAARLYKDFPLVGTEDWNLPYLIQSDGFRPPEQRDGVRLKKTSEEEVDPVADTNRTLFLKLPEAIQMVFESLKLHKVSNLHLLAETGLPLDPFRYVDQAWYIKNVQQPLRTYFQDQPLVRTSEEDAPLKKVQECLFIDYPYEQGKETFYDLVSALKPANFPDKSSYLSWDLIMHQEKDKWPAAIYYSPDRLINDIVGFKSIGGFPFADEVSAFNWLNRLLALIREHNLVLLDDKAIFPSQANTLHLKKALKVDTLGNDRFKKIVGVLDTPVLSALVSDLLTVNDGFELFDTKTFVKVFHDNISKIEVRELATDKLSSLLDLVSMFRGAPSPVRDEMYSLVKDVLPEAPEQTIVEDMQYYEWTTPDLLIIKYCCCVVEKEKSFLAFAKASFADSSEKTMKWLKRLRSYLLKEEERRAPLLQKYKITPMQSGYFDYFTTECRSEDSIDSFPKLLKDMYRDYVKGKDPYSWLIDRAMGNESFILISLSDFCKPIDSLFLPEDVDLKVKPKGLYNKLFHELHDYYKGISDSQGRHLFPHFSAKLGELLHKAFGASVSRQVLLLQKWERTEEELEQLTTLKLPAKDLASLEAAALKVGVPAILEQVAQIEAGKETAAWRRRVGGNAEKAFVNAIKGVKVELLDYGTEDAGDPFENPDNGRDFTMRLRGWSELYSIEVKSIGHGRDSVTMSMKQGQFAKEHLGHYALCVVTREVNDEVSLEQFLGTALFVTSIGELVTPKIDAVKAGISSLEVEEAGDINISLDNKKYSINVGKKIWSAGLSFDQFIAFLQSEFPRPAESSDIVK